MKKFIYILLFLPLFLQAQTTATKTWTFTGSADGWTWNLVSGAPASAGYGTNNLQFSGEVGRNKTGDGYFSVEGTFASIFGIGASDVVTGYSNASFSGECTIWTSGDYYYEGDVSATLGSLNINDGTDRVLISNQSSYTGTEQTHTPSVDPNIGSLSLSGSTTIKVMLYVAGGNLNNSSAQVGGTLDNVSITIEYTPAASRRVFIIN